MSRFHLRVSGNVEFANVLQQAQLRRQHLHGVLAHVERLERHQSANLDGQLRQPVRRDGEDGQILQAANLRRDRLDVVVRAQQLMLMRATVSIANTNRNNNNNNNDSAAPDSTADRFASSVRSTGSRTDRES